MDRCRIGFIGAGGVAARHARTVAAFADAEIAGVTDPVPNRATELAAEHGATPYPDTAAMLAAAKLDALYICVPPFAHGEPERAAIAAGLPFFVEKPLALDLPTAARIAAAVRERGLLTAVGHHWRYLDILDEARRLLAGRTVRLVLGHWLDKVPPVAWWVRRDSSGGQVVEQAVHLLDLSRVLVGEVTEVHAIESGSPPPGWPADGAGDLVDAATVASLRFAGGAVGSLASTCLLGWKHRAGLQVYADGLALEITETELTVDTGSGPQVTVASADGDRTAKRRVDRAFLDAVGGGDDDVRAGYQEALRTHALACAVARSAATGEPVRIGQPVSEAAR